jgi:phage I-like protein
MNAKILNKGFEHPVDGWYEIEALGRHPNRAAGIVQVIDGEAAMAIANRFNEDAAAGNLRHGNELLIDHEHFKEQEDKESVAYGWLTQLQNRADGIYGQIRWTGTGQKAVDGGDYRFFSTEYEPGDCQVVKNRTGLTGKTGLTEMRPMRLAGLSLTNMHNNRGQRPITNRGEQPTANTQHPTSKEEAFRRALELAAGSEIKNREASDALAAQKQKEIDDMKLVATKLGLSADASEEVVLVAMDKIVNRATQAEGQVAPLTLKITELESQNATLLGEQIVSDLAAAGIKDEKIINRSKTLLADPKHFKNREERVAFIKELVPAKAVSQTKLQNRDTRAPAGGKGEDGAGVEDAAAATKIMNRATELVAQKRAPSMATAIAMAQNEVKNAS